MRFRSWVTVLALVVLPASAVAEDAKRPLFVVHFEKGEQWQEGIDPGAQKGFVEHSPNMAGLRREGRIVFGARYGEFGMIFLAAGSLDEARQTVSQDPAVVSGIFKYRIAELNVFYDWRE